MVKEGASAAAAPGRGALGPQPGRWCRSHRARRRAAASASSQRRGRRRRSGHQHRAAGGTAWVGVVADDYAGHVGDGVERAGLQLAELNLQVAGTWFHRLSHGLSHTWVVAGKIRGHELALRTCLRSRELEPDKALRSNSRRLVKRPRERSLRAVNEHPEASFNAVWPTRSRS